MTDKIAELLIAIAVIGIIAMFIAMALAAMFGGWV